MTSPVDIRPDHLEIVQDILIKNLPAGVKVWVFGSRANWTTKDSSDLDLALEGEGRLSHTVLGALKDAFEDSSLPYTVDVVDFNRIGDAFKQIVELQRTPLPTISRSLDMVDEWRVSAYGPFSIDYYEDRLEDLCVAKDGIQTGPFGSQLHQRDYVERGTPIITVKHLGDNRIIHQDLPLVSDADKTRLAKYTLNAGDIVFSRVGSVDRRAYVTDSENGWLFSGRCLRVRVDPDKMDSRFLSYFFGLPSFQEHIRSIAVGATMPSLNTQILSNIKIHYPPLPEQRAIARILGTLDDKIELNRRMNETLEAIARALFKSWFVDFDPVRAKMAGRDTGLPPHIAALFPDRLVPSELGEIPEGWEVKELGELGELAYGKALRAVDRKDGPIPVYGSNGQIGWHDANLVAGPGIVVGRKGNPGVVTWTHGDFFPIDTTFYVVPKDPGLGLPFLFFALTGQDLPSLSADSAVPGLNRNLAYMNKQLVPDKQVLAEFNHHASAIFSRQHQLEKECRLLAAQRDALLPELVSGEVRVKEG